MDPGERDTSHRAAVQTELLREPCRPRAAQVVQVAQVAQVARVAQAQVTHFHPTPDHSSVTAALRTSSLCSEFLSPNDSPVPTLPGLSPVHPTSLQT